MIKLNKCCFCLELKTGVLVLGWLGVIGGILQVISNILQYKQIADLDGKIEGLNMTKAAIIMTIVSFILSIIISSLLIIAVNKNERKYLLPYLVFGALQMILLVVTSIVMITAGMNVQSLIVIVIILALAIYFWLCVYSYYQEMESHV